MNHGRLHLISRVLRIGTGWEASGGSPYHMTTCCLPISTLLLVSTSLGNSGLCWTVFARNKDTAVPAEGNGDLQTLFCVLVARPRRCLTLSNPVPWQNWMAVYLGYTLRIRKLFRGWPIMVNDTHTRRRIPPMGHGLHRTLLNLLARLRT